jgi:hypothetical protein
MTALWEIVLWRPSASQIPTLSGRMPELRPAAGSRSQPRALARCCRVRELDEITDRGSGAWGGVRYDVELLTNTRTWTDSAGTKSRSLREWHVNCSGRVGRRRFQSEAERDGFIRASFTELRLDRVIPAEQRPRTHPQQELLHRHLSSLWFVWDYVQLRFDEPPINCYLMPTILQDNDPPLRHGARGYADTLLAQIGARLIGADELLDLGLVLDLDSGVRLAVDLRQTTVPEAVEFSGQERGWIWVAGEPPWDPASDNDGDEPTM